MRGGSEGWRACALKCTRRECSGKKGTGDRRIKAAVALGPAVHGGACVRDNGTVGGSISVHGEARERVIGIHTCLGHLVRVPSRAREAARQQTVAGGEGAPTGFKFGSVGMAQIFKKLNYTTKTPNTKVVSEVVEHYFHVAKFLKLMIFWEKSNEDQNCFLTAFGVFERLNGKIGKSAN